MIINNNKIEYNGYKGDEKLEELLDPYMGCLDLVPIEELKTCPFCEGDAKIMVSEIVTSDPNNSLCYYVKCTKCGLKTRGVHHGDILKHGIKATPLTAMKSVITLWNNRVEDDTDNQEGRT